MEIEYRGFIIEPAGSPGMYFWLNVDEYDGPESTCCGTERGVKACKAAIDEYMDEEKEPKRERCYAGACGALTTRVTEDHTPACSMHGGRK